VDVFNRHNEEVKRRIPAERLLVFEAAQGWEPLCRFLSVPIPATPFPRTNTTEEFKARIAERRAKAGA
jgi:Sulfotransferase domain